MKSIHFVVQLAVGLIGLVGCAGPLTPKERALVAHLVREMETANRLCHQIEVIAFQTRQLWEITSENKGLIGEVGFDRKDLADSDARARKCATDSRSRVQAAYQDVAQAFKDKPEARDRLQRTLDAWSSMMDGIPRFSAWQRLTAVELLTMAQENDLKIFCGSLSALEADAPFLKSHDCMRASRLRLTRPSN
jgi:hypothetical protein